MRVIIKIPLHYLIYPTARFTHGSRNIDAHGEEALSDKRGRHKTDDEVDELEHLRRENLRLKRQLEEKDMLTELLKK